MQIFLHQQDLGSYNLSLGVGYSEYQGPHGDINKTHFNLAHRHCCKYLSEYRMLKPLLGKDSKSSVGPVSPPPPLSKEHLNCRKVDNKSGGQGRGK